MNRVPVGGLKFLVDPLCDRYPGGFQIREQRLLHRLR